MSNQEVNLVAELELFLATKFGITLDRRSHKIVTSLHIGGIGGRKIWINENARHGDELLFIIAHLFGHMVQFSNYDKYRDLVEFTERPKPLLLSGRFVAKFARYEQEAFGYGQKLLELALESRVDQLMKQKLYAYFRCDLRLFMRFLATGQAALPSEFDAELDGEYSLRLGRTLQSLGLPTSVYPHKSAIIY